MKITGLALIFTLTTSSLFAQTTDSTTARPGEPFFTKRDIYRAAGFVVGTVVATQFDERLADFFQDSSLQENSTFKSAANFFNFMGQPAPQIIGVGLFGVGHLIHSSRMQRLGLHGFEAMIMSNVITTSIKITAGRARPLVKAPERDAHDYKLFRGTKGSDYQSFPSGHATTAFAAASAVTGEITQWAHESNWSPVVPIAVGVTMYGGATLVGVARMYSDKHWASDVMAGAAIGTFSGIKVVRYVYRHPGNLVDRTLLSTSFVPLDDGRTAVAWTIKF